MSEPDHNARHRFITDPYGAGHYEKLGRFVFQYARAGAYFHLAFRFYSKMPIGEARILFGGPSRISDVIDRTTRMMKLYKVKKEIIDDFKEIEQKFKQIGSMRDRILHRGWSFRADAFVVTDIATARVTDEAEIFSIKFAEMDDMIEDLIRVWMRIRYRHIGDNQVSPPPLMDTPWRY